MTRRGRPRKAGPRNASGRLKQPTAAELRQFTIAREIEEQSLVLAARCRQMGLPVTQEAMIAMRSQMAGCHAGQAILRHVDGAEDRSRLFAAVTHIRRVQARYDASIGAPRRHAVCLRLLVPLDATETSADAPAYDDRSEEERARSAVSAWMAVHGWLGFASRAAASQVWRSCVDDEPVRDVIGLLDGLRCVAEGLAGERIAVRSGK